jgi:hypothetical protein
MKAVKAHTSRNRTKKGAEPTQAADSSVREKAARITTRSPKKRTTPRPET